MAFRSTRGSPWCPSIRWLEFSQQPRLPRRRWTWFGQARWILFISVGYSVARAWISLIFKGCLECRIIVLQVLQMDVIFHDFSLVFRQRNVTWQVTGCDWRRAHMEATWPRPSRISLCDVSQGNNHNSWDLKSRSMSLQWHLLEEIYSKNKCHVTMLMIRETLDTGPERIASIPLIFIICSGRRGWRWHVPLENEAENTGRPNSQGPGAWRGGASG